MDSSVAEREFIGAVKDEWLMYSDVAADYTRLSPIGFGASSIVYQAIYHYKNPQTGKIKDLPCALKVLNLDKLAPPALRLLTRETQLMSLSKHPNVLRVRGSWMMGPQLYIAMRLMNKGSVADILKYSFIDGLEEDVVKCILYQALQGLNYLHINGFIHRDIKAANLLVDDDGTVLLGDLGVAVSLTEDEDAQNALMPAVRRGLSSGTGAPLIYGAKPTPTPNPNPTNPSGTTTLKKRKSFVGTPSWMAPEVITQQHYDSSADIWSLGITVIEMCSGRAPGSRERDVKRVLLRTLQNAPPTLEREGAKWKYSRALKEFVDSCLVKDPAQRPTAETLLKHDIFKNVKKKSYLVGTLLAGLPPLAERQERQVVQPTSQHPHGQAVKQHKAHPLALGSPSMTSIQNTKFSWEWNFSNPGSPRSTVYSKHDVGGNHTPPASIRSGSIDGHGVSPSGSVTSLHLHHAHPHHHHPHAHHHHHHHPPGVPHLGHTRSRSRTSTANSDRPSSASPTRMRNHSRVPSFVPPDHELDVEEEEPGDDANSEEMKMIDRELEKLGVKLSNSPERLPFAEPVLHGEDEEDGEEEFGGCGRVEDLLATPHVHPVMQSDLGEVDQDALALPDVSSSASSLSPRTPPSGLPPHLSDTTRPVAILTPSNPNTPRSSPTTQPFFPNKEKDVVNNSNSGTVRGPAVSPKRRTAAIPIPTKEKESGRSSLWKKVRKALPDRKNSQGNIKDAMVVNPAAVVGGEGGDAKKMSSAASRMFGKLERQWSRT